MSLQKLGLSTEDEARYQDELPNDASIGRVCAVDRNGWVVDLGRGPLHAETTGRLRFAAESEMELPTTGDWVEARQVDDDLVLITGVLSRRTLLRRRRPGSQSLFQLIAANIDTAFIVHPADQPVHRRRLDRYLVAVRDGGMEPLIVLSKSDLVADEVVEASLLEAGALAPSVAVSSVGEGGIRTLEGKMQPGRTYALLGPSGVGKSTLLNRLLGREEFATQAVREGDQRGRHTTTRRQLVRLDSGALVIDTPGMREFGMTDMAEGVEDQFADIAEWATQCRFADCTHTEEPGCRVLEAVSTGDLAEERLGSFMKLGREAAYYERSHLEARQRDKHFGKLYKSILKAKKDRR